MSSHRQRNISEEPSSPEDGSNFRRSLQIDMKGLVGSAVGNMSISPWSRDVVLAARKGLFIIDLEAPLNVPRFLPQGGTWDVADVQWNPHMSRIEYIVSTSSEKLLIWNLYLAGKTSIEFILRSHYRAITDINWHTFDPDVVVSTGIDSWLWAWDLRTPRKPVLGLCAFNAGGTQVKWNRQDGNIIASSHANEVLIWDRRKGSLPTSRISAHGAKIYGIDWSHDSRSEIVTCSLDKTIKIWDVLHPSEEDGGNQFPKTTIQTAYPVWRARNLPFGQGVLSLPQRGETGLEMWVPDCPQEPIYKFEGHADVVKEFVWRKGGQEDSDFQLITWSKDKTLRFWPVDAEVMQKAGKATGDNAPHVVQTTPLQSESIISFSNPPLGSDLPPALSAPVGLRGILAEVRASQVSRPLQLRPARPSQDLVPLDHENEDTTPGQSETVSSGQGKGAPNRGYVGGRSAQITTFAWLSSVKVGKREDSSGPGSGGESATVSRIHSRSRPPSLGIDPISATPSELRRGTETREKFDEEHREADGNQSLQEEITSVVNRLTASKVKLEKADLTKKRTCTFGLHGPWGEATSVFIRISFTFPKDYPQAAHPGGTPQVDLERNPLISMKSRVLILRRLRAIRERQRPCLETCLRFLLFGDEEDDLIGPRPTSMDSESSSEDEAYPIARRYRDGGISLLRGDKNLAEPRTSQGVFGMNGQLVCFFRAPPRIVRNLMRDLSVSPSIGSRGPDTTPRLFRSPVLLSDAIRRLSLAANDREVEPPDSRKAEDANSILRIMSNLYTFSHPKVRKFSENSRPSEDVPTSYSLLPTRRSTVFIKDASSVVGQDTAAATQYVFPISHPLNWCAKNAEIACHNGRIYHQRVFTMLQVMIVDGESRDGEENAKTALTPLMMKLVEKLYAELLSQKDIQMLSMMAVMLFQLTSSSDCPATEPIPEIPFLTPSSPLAGLDYFSITRRLNSGKDSLLPHWAHTSPSPTPQSMAPALASPSSSRGSWSSLFTTSNMRRLMSGTQRDDEPGHRRASTGAIPMVGSRSMHSNSPSPLSGVGMYRKDSPRSSQHPVSNLWSDTGGFPSQTTVPLPLAGHVRRPTFSQVVSSNADRKRLIFEPDPRFKTQQTQFLALEPRLRSQLACHILAYAEMLSAWQLPHKRSELLKSVDNDLRASISDTTILTALESSPLGVIRICKRCGHENHLGIDNCASCGARLNVERCTVCRLPIRGLSHICLLCLHDTHVKCWNMRKAEWCASGCGCPCQFVSEQGLSNLHEETLSPLNIGT